MQRFKGFTTPAQTAALLLLSGAVFNLLLSPKWVQPVAAWLAPAIFLYYIQHVQIRFKWLWMLLVLVPTGLVASLDVMPFPWFIMVAVILLDAGKTIGLYALHRWLVNSRTSLGWTLVFPALWTVREFWETRGEIGTFASVANTQFGFPWLVQLASVTGLWGITFLVYWFASVAVWALNARQENKAVRQGVGLYLSVLLAVLTFGAIRYQTNEVSQAPKLAVGGVTVSNLPILQALYRDETGRPIQLDPELAPGSPVLQEANKGLIGFVTNPVPGKYRYGRQAIQWHQDSLFRLSRRAVERGAKLVLWSEGNALLLKTDENALLERGTAFAKRYRVYLLMAMGVLHPGPLLTDPDNPRSVRPFLENKTVMIDPSGQIVNVFHKNHPVPFAEPSRPGNGQVPAVVTPVGTLAPSICYDAEHTATMQQLARKRVGLLLLPSGDWRAIAPYHSHMAIFRAVENGCSLARQVSGGLSVFTDYRGRVLASRDAFAPGDNLTVVSLPVASVPTLYARFGDWLAYLAMVLLLTFGIKSLIDRLHTRKLPRQPRKETTVSQSQAIQ